MGAGLSQSEARGHRDGHCPGCFFLFGWVTENLKPGWSQNTGWPIPCQAASQVLRSPRRGYAGGGTHTKLSKRYPCPHVGPEWAAASGLVARQSKQKQPAQLNVNFRQRWTVCSMGAELLLSSETPWPWATKSPEALPFSSGKKRCSRSPPRAVSRTKM